MRCAQCNEENAWTLARCRSCGAPLAASAGPAAGRRAEGPSAPYQAPSAYRPPPYPVPGGREAGPPGFAFDARRWTLADQVSGGATLVLLVSLFLPWFGAGGAFFGVSLDGMWHGYMVVDLVVAIAIAGYLVLRAGFGSVPFGLSATATAYLLAGAAGVNVLLAAVSFLTKPYGTSWQYGAFTGLAAAMVAATATLRSAMLSRR